MMKGRKVRVESLRVQSAGILEEYLTMMVFLQTKMIMSPKVQMGIMIGMKPLYIKAMKRKRRICAVSEGQSNCRLAIFSFTSFWITGSSASLASHILFTRHCKIQFFSAKTITPITGEMKDAMINMFTQQGVINAYQSTVKSLNTDIFEKSMKFMNFIQLTNCIPKMLPFKAKGRIVEFMQLEMSTPQKTKRYSLGMVFGLRTFQEIRVIAMVRIILVIEETIDPAIWSMLVIRILLVTEEQKVLTVESVYIASKLALQQQNLAVSPWGVTTAI